MVLPPLFNTPGKPDTKRVIGATHGAAAGDKR